MRLRRSIVAALGQRYVTVALSMMVAMVSARMLGPEDFGEFAIAHSIIVALGRVTRSSPRR